MDGKRTNILSLLRSAQGEGRTLFAMLIDPDNVNLPDLPELVKMAEGAGVDLFFVGGSLMVSDQMDYCLQAIRSSGTIPTVLFPGNPLQLSEYADALLYLSLISGRNPELLIGHHVATAPRLMRSSLEIMPTGYMLIDGGAPTTASYISNTWPIPSDKPDIATATAMAGQLLGLRLIYLDAGSGAKNPVSSRMIQAVCDAVDLPVIVGGGIRTTEDAARAAKAGATVIVVGNRLEENPGMLTEMVQAVRLSSHVK